MVHKSLCSTKGLSAFLTAMLYICTPSQANDCPSGMATHFSDIEGKELQLQLETAAAIRDFNMLSQLRDRAALWQKKRLKAYVSDQLYFYQISNKPSCLLGSLSRIGAIDAASYWLEGEDKIYIITKSGDQYAITKSQLIGLAEAASR